MGWGVMLYLLWIADVDRRTCRIPNLLLTPIAVVGAVAAVQSPLAAGAAVTAVVPYLLGFFRRGCGGGDVKLAACCGALLASPAAAAFAVLLAALGALAGSLLTGIGRRPHGPALIGATVAVSLVQIL